MQTTSKPISLSIQSGAGGTAAAGLKLSSGSVATSTAAGCRSAASEGGGMDSDSSEASAEGARECVRVSGSAIGSVGTAPIAALVLLIDSGAGQSSEFFKRQVGHVQSPETLASLRRSAAGVSNPPIAPFACMLRSRSAWDGSPKQELADFGRRESD